MICSKLGWQKSTGAQKQRQIKTIEESFEFYHPISPKTGKEKKSYIFTRIIKEPILSDGRKNNGGYRETAGRKAFLPEEEFDYLWKVVVSKAYELNAYYEREWLNKVYFANSLLFREFGFPYSDYLKNAKFEENDNIVKYLFSDIVYEALKANTVTRLCRRYNFPKNSLPKGILRSRSKERIHQIISDDKLVPQWDIFEKENLKRLKCKNVIEAVRQGKYQELMEAIQQDFERKRKYNVQKYNVIQVNDFDVIGNGKNFGHQDKEHMDKRLEYQKHFREVIVTSVSNSCVRRIKDTENKYKMKLNQESKDLLRKYLFNMLYINEPTVYEYGWLRQIS